MIPMFHGQWVPRVMACAQTHRVLVDFTPESRDYGEMPLKAGEEVGNAAYLGHGGIDSDGFRVTTSYYVVRRRTT